MSISPSLRRKYKFKEEVVLVRAQDGITDFWSGNFVLSIVFCSGIWPHGANFCGKALRNSGRPQENVEEGEDQPDRVLICRNRALSCHLFCLSL